MSATAHPPSGTAAVGAATLPAALAAESDLPTVTVTPDPSYAGQPFEGWGTSLVWFANATGDYPDEIREELADMVFGPDGLNLNIARYNVGGGNAPDVPPYLRAGGAVDGWWKAPEGTTRTDVDWWDPADPDHWDPDADATQRWWVDRIKDDVTHWETFSNSPPWFMTVSGYVSGGFSSTADQLKTESIDDFAAYMVGVTERLEDAHGIEVDTIDPFNEPNTNYWGTQLGSDGNPTGGRQEGAHMGPGLQAQVIPALADALDGSATDAVIAAMDETNPGTFATNWNSYPDAVRDQVAQLNVHTYGTGQRTTVRDIAKGEDKPLWMSEVGGNWSSTGQDFETMESGVGSAQHIIDDLRELEPSAWVFWQPVEDYNNMAPGGESANGMNWGEIQIPFDCTAEDTLATCPIYTNTKYWATQNFTHYIEPGDSLIGTDDLNSTAAVAADGESATVVHVNAGESARAVELDLSGFGEVAADATVTPVVTSTAGYLVEGEAVAVEQSGDAAPHATLTVPAESVTTFVVDGVSGVADDAALVQAGHVYRLDGAQSNRSLAPAATGDGVVIRTDAAVAEQAWELTALGAPEGSGTHRTRYAVTNAATGEQLAVDAETSAVLVPAPDDVSSTPLAAQWTLSTTGDGTYTLVNASSKTLLEVGGQATADGSPVGTYLANSGINQRWRIVDETVLGTQDVEAFTTPGVAPELPDVVTPVYRDGARGGLPVTWDVPGDEAWAQPGTVEVTGTVALPTGGEQTATARVVVDTLERTLPARAKAYAGGEPELPTTVSALAAGGDEVQRPVTWDDAPAGAFDEVGVVELTGTADAGVLDGEPTTLPAVVRVQVTEATSANGALATGTTTAATFTEPGYSVTGVVNGVLTDKAWSNWVSGTKRANDTLTVTLPAERDVTGVVTHFWKDGSSASWAQSVRAQALVDGTWTDVGEPVAVDAPTTGPAPAVTVPVDVRTSAVRVVLTARDNTHMVVSEIEVLAKVPGTGTDAAASGITVDGEALAGFDPEVTAYAVAAGDVPEVAAVAHDPYASVDVAPAEEVPGTTTVRVTAEDGSTRDYTIAWSADAPAAPLTVTADTRCLAGKVFLAVRATNDGETPLDITLSTPFGTRTVADVAPGRSAYQSFATRAASIEAGEAQASAAGADASASYAAADCG
ncbi:Ig-like domain-containing protein [Oerskovia flava]|uniref:Ig-like domain-containing protein n=1 Tax=Oerskovia flava TaxID=2986422 RepID=UPI00224021B4|nr:Ig-like domain-containing protein [Oerskovia sp. JB1-3-2]